MMAKDMAEFVKEGLREVARIGGEVVKDVGYETAIDALINTYKSLLMAWARRYLDCKGSDPELLARHRRKFCKIVRMSTSVIEEIDCYITGKYTNLWAEVSEVLAPEVKRAERGGE